MARWSWWGGKQGAKHQLHFDTQQFHRPPHCSYYRETSKSILKRIFLLTDKWILWCEHVSLVWKPFRWLVGEADMNLDDVQKCTSSLFWQICYKESTPGKMYCVDCEIGHSGIPYSDSFYVVLRYCLTRVSRTKCRVRITSELKFRKHVMGMIKGDLLCLRKFVLCRIEKIVVINIWRKSVKFISFFMPCDLHDSTEIALFFTGMIEKSAVNGLTDNFRCLCK